MRDKSVMNRLVLALSVMFMAPLTADVQLIPESMVDGPHVVLGDLFTGIEHQTHVAICATPPAGKKRIFSPQDLEKIAQQHGILWEPQGPEDQVTVTGVFDTFTSDDIITLLRPEIQKAVSGLSFSITLEKPGLQIATPAAQHSDFRIRSVDLLRNRTMFVARLEQHISNAPQKEHRIVGKITPLACVPCLRHPLSQGEVVTASDLHWVDVPQTEVGAQTLMQESDLIGTTPRQSSLRQDTPLKKSDVYRPLTIKKGEMVALHAQTDCMFITTRGQAQENGLMGEAIKVLNLRSNRVVHATVAGPKLAVVEIITTEKLS